MHPAAEVYREIVAFNGIEWTCQCWINAKTRARVDVYKFGNEWIHGESFIESPLDELQNNLSLEIIGFCLDR